MLFMALSTLTCLNLRPICLPESSLKFVRILLHDSQHSKVRLDVCRRLYDLRLSRRRHSRINRLKQRVATHFTALPNFRDTLDFSRHNPTRWTSHHVAMRHNNAYNIRHDLRTTGRKYDCVAYIT